MKCHKCKQEMQMTPLCIHCGIIPIAAYNQVTLSLSNEEAKWLKHYLLQFPDGDPNETTAHAVYTKLARALR